MKIEDAILLLPGYIKEAVGNLTIPLDNGLQISRELTQRNTTFWTDGTVKNKIGAHAYIISPSNDNNANSIKGTGGTLGNSSTMTSLRAEHFGVFVVIILTL